MNENEMKKETELNENALKPIKSKGQKRLVRVLLSKSFIFTVLAVLQIGMLITFAIIFADTGIIAYTAITIISALILIGILEKDELNPAYKMMWVILIVILPVAGVLFYLMFGQRKIPRSKQRRFAAVDKRADEASLDEMDENTLECLNGESRHLYQSAKYLMKHNLAPLYVLEGVEYYPLGKDFYPPFLEALKKAKRYIFLQYYIWNYGEMLDDIVEILTEKAAQGVDVRIIYDGFGAMFNIAPNFWHELTRRGIKSCAFSPIGATIHFSDYGMLNHRDHRKIAVVDGEVAFSGGLNIADEYVNMIERFGEWKDTSFKLMGKSVYIMALTFLRTWDYINNVETDYEKFKGNFTKLPYTEMCLQRGYVQPYWDSPLDDENVSENTYLNIVRHAVDYVYISTPYLILDNEMITNLTLAAKSGVDVRIMTPGIPDKRLVFLATRSNYASLIRGGVKIYEYTPGFNHAKMIVSDDRVAVVGSANMDFRSFYLHFENGAVFYGGEIVNEVKQDLVGCMDKSRLMREEDSKARPFWRRILQLIARFFGPLM